MKLSCLFFGLSFVFSVTAQTDSLLFAQKVKTVAPLAQPTTRGVWFEMLQPGSGEKVGTEQYLLFSYEASVINGATFDKTKPEDPFICLPGSGAIIEGVDAVLPELRKGDICRVFVPAALGFGDLAVGTVPPKSALLYKIEVKDVLSFAQYDSVMNVAEDRERRNFERRDKAYFEEHKRKVNDYAVKKKLKTKRTESGLSYSITKPGKGAMAQVGDSVFVQYQGYLIDGDKLFDGTKGKKAVFGFKLGNGGVIDAWEEGLLFYNKGAEGWLILPAKLGYGASELTTKSGILPPYSPLAFKLKVIDIRPLK